LIGEKAPLGTEVVELGLLNASIHQVDEHTPVDDLDALARVYKHIMMRILSG
jgi:succinyl-diaminopimelate desuccinylase